MINVTKTFLPEKKKFQQILDRAWDKVWLTNRGELTLELEEKIQKKYATTNMLITNNGTIPIQIALKLLGNQGEIITTPFSYVATTSAIIWEYCTPVFVDIHPEFLTIDESKIEAAITSKTTAILATHVFGNPCEVEAIEQIALKHNLKVIYDAAHCFGVEFNNKSIFNYGDVSTCSFHATKVFHTGEGGAIFCKDKDLFHKLFYSHNFGHDGPLAFHGVGINAKISELQSAMGLAVFDEMDYIFEERKKVVEFYLKNLHFDNISTIRIREKTKWNYSYFPVIFESETVLLHVEQKLKEQNITPRRYFYPSLNTVSFVTNSKMPISESTASRILCLPLYVGLEKNDLEKITTIINTVLKC